MTAVGALFLLAPLVPVPHGFRLIELGRPLADPAVVAWTLDRASARARRPIALAAR